jgi:hypothetical protein
MAEKEAPPKINEVAEYIPSEQRHPREQSIETLFSQTYTLMGSYTTSLFRPKHFEERILFFIFRFFFSSSLPVPSVLSLYLQVRLLSAVSSFFILNLFSP